VNKEIHLLKMAAFELNSQNDLVKTAGFVGKIVSFVKSILDSDFREQKQEFSKELEPIKYTLSNIYDISKDIQSSIDSGDFSKYKYQLEKLKEQANLLAGRATKLNVANERFYQSKKDLADEAIRQELIDNLPENYDIPLRQNIGKPFKSFKFNSDISAEDLNFSSGNLKTLNAILSEKEINYEILPNSRDEIKIKEAIIDGTLIRADLKWFDLKPSDKDPSDEKNIGGQKVPAGETILEITSQPVTLGDYRAEFKVYVGDQRTSRERKRRLYVKKFKVTKLATAKIAALKFDQKQVRPHNVTQLSELDLANVLKSGYKMTFGSEPTLSMLASGWAQVILESGRPVKLPNNNVGNIKATKQWVESGKPFFMKSTEEFTAAGKHFIDKDAKWRAYETPEEGAAGYWKLLKDRYGSALEYFDIGDPVSAGVALGKSSYYTANIQKYSTAVGKLYAEFLKKYGENFSSLKPKSDANLPKLEVKNWRQDYASPAKAAPAKPVVSEKPANFAVNDNDEQLANELYKQLLANDKNKVSLFIKEASENKPIYGIVKLISGTHEERVKFATVASSLAYQHYKISSEINYNDKELDISFKSSGKDINNLSKICSEINNYLPKVQSFLLPNFVSEIDNEISISDIL